MKKQVFTTAWELVRSLGINLSNALKIAWAKVKVSAMQDQIDELESKAFTGGQVKAIEKVQFPLMKIITELMPLSIRWSKEYDNSGARFDYGRGTYNGD